MLLILRKTAVRTLPPVDVNGGSVLVPHLLGCNLLKKAAASRGKVSGWLWGQNQNSSLGNPSVLSGWGCSQKSFSWKVIILGCSI